MSKLWMYSTLMLSGSVWAGSFIDNSSVELTTRNFYFDRDYQEQSAYPAAKDWTQGFILKPIQAIPKEPLVLGWMYLQRQALNWMPAQNTQVQETYLETRVPMSLLTLMEKLASQQKLK